MIGEHIRMALRNFRANKMRTALSFCGILIGVSAVITITSLGKSASVDILGEFGDAGLDIIMIDGGWGNARAQRTFSIDLSERLRGGIGEISFATPVYETGVLVKSPYREESYSLRAVSPQFQHVFHLTVGAGRFFSPFGGDRRFPGIMVGSTVAQRLFPTGGAVGSTVRIVIAGTSHHLQVIGVLSPRDNTMGMSFNDAVFIDINYLSARIMRLNLVSSLYVSVRDASTTVAAQERIRTFLTRETSDPSSFWVDSPASMTKAVREITTTLNLALAGIAAISLLVGGIGIMNIMLVSVTERTREIGIRKALGAPASAIRMQFLIESSALTLIGAGFGSGVGFGVARLITPLLDLPFVPDWRAFFLAQGISVVIGVFFGWYPAVRAARLDPIVALSHE